MGKFQSSKIFDGFNTSYRQWEGDKPHKFLHGFNISFKLYFEGELDTNNWVMDFGFAKNSKTLIDGKQPKEWMDYTFNHTVLISEDDPGMGGWKTMDGLGVIQLRIIPTTGAESFAKYIFDKINPCIQEETEGRVRLTKVKFMEHGKNAACYVD
jgi:6-pyruvoyltetrahydropterin/6-carboxytetrahydropterin synthase